MPEFKLKQLHYERDTWKRFLGFMKVENIYLKYRLAELLKNNIDNNSLEDIEIFYTRFLKQDDINTLLGIEISGLDNLLSKEVFGDEAGLKKVQDKIQTVRKDIESAEQKFRCLKSEFSNYISEILQLD